MFKYYINEIVIITKWIFIIIFIFSNKYKKIPVFDISLSEKEKEFVNLLGDDNIIGTFPISNFIIENNCHAIFYA